MPIQTKCPSCERPLRVPDDLIGKTVRCPGCKTMWLVEPEGGAAPPPDDTYRSESEPEPPAERPAGAFREAAVPPAAPRPEPPADDDAPRRPTPRLGRDRDDFDDDDELDHDDEEMEEQLRERRRERRAAERVVRSRARVKVPAIGLMVTGGAFLLLGLAVVGLGAVLAVKPGALGPMFGGPPPGGPGAGGPPPAAVAGMRQIQLGIMAGSAVFDLAFGVLILLGGRKMYRLQGWGLSLTACIVAIVASLLSCCGPLSFVGIGCLGIALPFSIWGLITLNDADVKASFT